MRRRRDTNDSLELLLDTICNTFGGILFLAILVCILLRNSDSLLANQSARPASEAEVASLTAAQQSLASQLAGLRAAVKEREGVISSLELAQLKPLLDQRRELQSQRDKQVDQIRQLTADCAARHAKALTLEKERTQLLQALSQAEKAEQSSAKALQSELAARTTTLTLPREQTSTKNEVCVPLRYGRLYLLMRYDRYGHELGPNTEELVDHPPQARSITVTPRRDRGLRLTSATAKEVHDRLAPFSPSDCHLLFLVWPDSFKEFEKAKNGAVELGFRYRVIIMDRGDTLGFGGGMSPHVQ